jgi:hypothetical protein
VSAVADERIREWRERYADELAVAAAGTDKAMAWWTGLGDDAFLIRDRGRWRLTEDGLEFADLFWGPSSDELAGEIIAAAADAGESGRCCPSMRRGTPAAAFYYALGAAGAARMPSCLGDFLITADEVAAAVPEVERILAGARHEELVERVGRWLDLAGDGSEPEARETVDGVLRVFHEAAARRLGVAAVSTCF